MRNLGHSLSQRFALWLTVLFTGANVGTSLLFWWSIFFPHQPIQHPESDYSFAPLISFGMIAFLTLLGIGMSNHLRNDHKFERRLLLCGNLLSFASTWGVALVMSYFVLQ